MAPVRLVHALDGEHGSFGVVLSIASDVDADEFSDLVVSAPDGDHELAPVYVSRGSATGLGVAPPVSITYASGDFPNFGGALSSAVDVNGDSYGDIVSGASSAMGRIGFADVFLGGAGGLGTALWMTLWGPEGPDGTFGVDVPTAWPARRGAPTADPLRSARRSPCRCRRT